MDNQEQRYFVLLRRYGRDCFEPWANKAYTDLNIAQKAATLIRDSNPSVPVLVVSEGDLYSIALTGGIPNDHE